MDCARWRKVVLMRWRREDVREAEERREVSVDEGVGVGLKSEWSVVMKEVCFVGGL